MARRPPRDKTTGLPLPDPVIPLETRCFTMTVPFAPEYVQALRGAVSDLGRAFNWSQTIGQDNTPSYTAAELWRKAATTIAYSENCEGALSCQQIIECIQNNPATQQAIFDYLVNNEDFKNFIRGQAGNRLQPPGVIGGNVLKPGQCDPDYIFSQVTTLVQVIHLVTIDLFQAIEVGTNALERAQLLIAGVPGLGAVLFFDEIIGAVDTIVSSVAEDYEGAWTITLEDKIRCDLFCLVKESCTLNLDEIIAFYEREVPAQLSSDPIQFILDIFDFIGTGNTPGNLSVYGMHLMVLAMMRAALTVFGTEYASVALRVIASGDVPNNDWQVLCDECAGPSDCLDFRASQQGWVVFLDTWGSYVPGFGFSQAGSDVNAIYIDKTSGYSQTVTSIEVILTSTVTSQVGLYFGQGGGQTGTITIPANSDRGRIETNLAPGTRIVIGGGPAANGLPSNVGFQQICLEFAP